MTLGERLARLRNQKGLSQDALAELLGVSRQSVSKWETDASVPELDKLVKLGDLFEVSLDELVRGEASPARPTVPEPQVRVWLQTLISLYREKAYLLGWLLVGWGLLGLINSIQADASFYAEFGWEDTAKYLQVISYFYIFHISKIVLGALILLCGRRFSGRFQWYHLGWGLVILGIFGCRPIPLLRSGLLETLLVVPLVYLPYYGPVKTQEFLALCTGDLGNLLACFLGLLIVLLGKHRDKSPM